MSGLRDSMARRPALEPEVRRGGRWARTQPARGDATVVRLVSVHMHALVPQRKAREHHVCGVARTRRARDAHAHVRRPRVLAPWRAREEAGVCG